MTEWKDWKKNDIIFGIIIPTVVVFLILILTSEVRTFFDTAFPDPSGQSILTAILVDGLGEAILTVAIPLFAGLIWNQWAGGAAGFITGSIYSLYVNDALAASQWWGNNMMIGDPFALGYLVTAMLIGYMAGALNRGSYSFRRMVVAALIAGIIASVIQVWTQVPTSMGGLSTFPMIADVDGVINALLTALAIRVVYGIIIPLFATVFGWYGISPRQMT